MTVYQDIFFGWPVFVLGRSVAIIGDHYLIFKPFAYYFLIY